MIPCVKRAFVEPGTVLDEETEAREKAGEDILHSNEKIPQYWSNRVSEEGEVKTNFDQMVYAGFHSHLTFDDMFRKSYLPIATQDRLCPKADEPCAKTPGGCQCVRPGGTPGLPTAYVVRRVIRVEDSSMWKRYLNRREEIKAKRESDPASQDITPPVLTNQIAGAHGEVLEPLDTSPHLSEVYLWHGTAVRTALAIAQDDFNIDLAGCGAGTMYGRGAYLAESCTKADEYSKDEPGGYYDGIYAMLLVRATLGKFYHTTTRDPEASQKVLSGEFDCTLGDRAASVNTYREFVIYNTDQLYPEYIVLYSRVYAANDELSIREQATNPFHMELPIYWTNCYCNPHTETFDVHYRVRRATRETLQRLVSGAISQADFKLRVIEARRVESSEMWVRYVKFKRSVSSLEMLSANGDAASTLCTPPNQLDADPNSGHALTSALMQEIDAEDAISVDNLDSSLNELLLWHGTCKESAEQISWGGFHIPKKERARHGKRFGEGAYFAEDLIKSMSYASADEDDTFYVLLCRTICGQIYYTEEKVETSAHETARSKGMHSILANPEKQGPREYILLEESQVYPEFILHLKKE
jgi:hypothetical protein